MPKTEPDRSVAAPPHPPGRVRTFQRVADMVAVVLFAALFGDYVLQVFMRYVMNDPLVWTLELAGILFIAVSLWTAAFCMDFKDHVRFDLLYMLVGDPFKRICIAVSLGGFLILALWSIPDTVWLLEYMYDDRTYALDMPMGHLFVLFMIFLLAYAVRAVVHLRRLFRTDWREHL